MTIWGVRILEGHLVTFRLKCDELWPFRMDYDDLGVRIPGYEIVTFICFRVYLVTFRLKSDELGVWNFGV